jgi:hypothetical protein
VALAMTPRHAGTLRRLVSTAAASLLALAVVRVDALPQEEHAVKAAFLLNFAKYIEWPPQALPEAGPLTVVLLGERGVDLIEASLAGRNVIGRPIAVRRARKPADIVACHLLFVAGDVERQLPAALRALAGRPVLSISDVEDQATTDAVINLFMVDGRVSFGVNLDAASAAGLPISSKLLALARKVRVGGREK